MYRAKMY